MKRNILITGGAGFIGSHVVEHFAEKYPEYQFTVMDSLTYAADVNFFNELAGGKYPNVRVYTGDIRSMFSCRHVMRADKIDAIIHLAAESHVDNSIKEPNIFAETNILGTLNLLNAAKEVWGKFTEDNRFYHISTDEVYGSLGETGYFYETTPYDPKSPYSASKAASDHFVRAYYNTYKLPVLISNCSNNYGERQHSEKLIPKAINCLLNKKKIPIYGKGENVRDWLYVKDHVEAIDRIFHYGKIGETYNIGGDCEYKNVELIGFLIALHFKNDVVNKDFDVHDHIEFVEDRKGHDFRYAINHDKISSELGWIPKTNIIQGLEKTYDYYKKKGS